MLSETDFDPLVFMIWAWSCLVWEFVLMEFGFFKIVLMRVSVEDFIFWVQWDFGVNLDFLQH